MPGRINVYIIEVSMAKEKERERERVAVRPFPNTLLYISRIHKIHV